MHYIYDVVIVPGRGFAKDGSLPLSSQSCIQRAVEVYKEKKTSRIIFSGKYSYTKNAVPPENTEAARMAEYARSLGLPKEAILLEEESQTTVENLCYSKKIITQYDWSNIAIVGVYPHTFRIKINAEYVFGDKFNIEILTADFQFPPEIKKQLEETEGSKRDAALEFFSTTVPGDERTILKNAREDLKNYIKAN